MLANLGNVVNSLYVFSLPIGPIWFLHLFNLACTLLMLAWHLRFAGRWGAARGVAATVEDRLAVLV